MSGIFGLIHTNGQPLEPQWLEGMQQHLRHRGPDGQGRWLKNHVGIGHLLLKVTPESEWESSPLVYKNLVVTADARLDARDELMDNLKTPPSDRLRTTDSLLIARAYEKWGQNCTDHLIGDFAFAIWDGNKRSLFCSRDHVGARPLFYYYHNHVFVFSSEISAIAKLPFVQKKLSEERIKDYLLTMIWGGANIEETFFEKIRRLMPARSLLLQEKNLSVSNYWKPEHKNTLRLSSDEEYADALRELIETAIRDRLRTQYPIGLTLSGGLDSSTVGCLSARMLAQKGRSLHAVSSVLPDTYQGPETDEKPYIEEVIGQEKNLTIDYIGAKGIGIFHKIHETLDKTHHPVNFFHYIDDALDQCLSEKHEVRLVLNGYLGDLTTSHCYVTSLAHLAYHLQLKSLVSLFQKRKKVRAISNWTLIKEEIVLPLTPSNLIELYRKLRGHSTVPFIDLTPISPTLIDSKNAKKRYAAYKKKVGSQINVYSNIWNIHSNLIDEEVTCRQAHHSLQYTYPLIDKRIIDFLFTLPPEQFLQGGWWRGLIRFSMKDILPPSILWRKDKGYYSPDFASRLYDDLLTIRQYIKEIYSDSFYSRFLDPEKQNKTLSRLYESGNYPTLQSEFISILGLGAMGFMFLEWFKMNYETNSDN